MGLISKKETIQLNITKDVIISFNMDKYKGDMVFNSKDSVIYLAIPDKSTFDYIFEKLKWYNRGEKAKAYYYKKNAEAKKRYKIRVVERRQNNRSRD